MEIILSKQCESLTGTLTFPLLDREEPTTVPTLENADHLIPEGTYLVKRTGTPSADELAARARFAAVSAAVKERAEDLQYIASDNAAFLAQKDNADGKKTMRAYLWAVCGAQYDQAHQG